MKDATTWARSVAELVRSYLAKSLGEIDARLKTIEAMPAAEKGEPGRDGKDGHDGVDGRSVTAEEVAAAIEPRIDAAIARAVLDVERRAQGVLERAVERMPRPADGKDGADGFNLDDLQIEDDGEGMLTLRFVRGELVRERTIRLPSVSDRGVFREGDDYRKGAGVSFGGSWWIAQKDAPQGKPGSSEDWRLAVKRGRDGRDSEK
jgi:integrin beta 3